MPPPCQTITAVSTGDVSLADDEVAARESLDVITDGINDTSKLVTNGHRHWNSFLRPVIPVVDVYVGAADGCFQYANQHVVAGNFWNRDVRQPKARLPLRLHNGLHHFLHEEKLDESGTQESMKVRERMA
jgi:hypothetical protein